MADAFENTGTGPMAPSKRLAAVTPSDATPAPYTIRQLYIGGAGDVSVVDDTGATTVFKAVPAGGHLGPFEVARVNASGTTATNLVAYF